MTEQDQAAGTPAVIATVLVTVAGPVNGAQDLLAAFTMAGARQATDFAEAVQSLDGDPAAHLVVLYPNPVLDLAARVAARRESPGLDEWSDAIRRILEGYRRHRRQVTLIDSDAAQTDPAGLSAVVKRRLGLDIDMPRRAQTLTEPAAPLMPRAVTEAVIRWSEGFRKLIAELQASSLPLSIDAATDALRLLEEWRSAGSAPSALSEQPEQPEKLRELEEENELLLLQLHQVQEELEANYLAGKGAADNRWSADQSSELWRLRDELRWKDADLEGMCASWSWKMTAPLRWGLDLVTGGRGRSKP